MKCTVCGAPATWAKTDRPFGWDRDHTSATCDAHVSYLHGHTWMSVNGREPKDCGVPDSGCATCGGKPYGGCGCPSERFAREVLQYEIDNPPTFVRITHVA
jgi:hypothetical protein